jgi:hypothetical protein
MPDTELKQHATGTQTQMLVRLTAGALNEAWELVTTRFLKTPLARDYLAMLDAPGQEALNTLKRQFGGSNLLNTVRNNFAFHHPRNDDVEAAFEAASADRELDDHWSLYFSDHGFNSLFFLSDLIYAHGIGLQARGGDLEEAHRKLMDEMSTASINIIEFAKAFFAAAWRKNFGAEFLAKDVVTISDAPNLDELWLPFFVEVS